MKLLFKLFLPVFFVVLFFFSPQSALAKSFYFPKVEIDVQINPDKSIDVTEKRTVSFTGSFTEMHWVIPLTEDQEISDSLFYENSGGQIIPYTSLNQTDSSHPAGYYFAGISPSEGYIQAYYSAYDESRDFILNYHITNVVSKYKDVGELYWKVIGDGWGTGIGDLTVVVSLPKEVLKKDIYVWGHGPLNGQAEIVDGKTATFKVKELPADTFVEVRELFPTDILNGSAISGRAP